MRSAVIIIVRSAVALATTLVAATSSATPASDAWLDTVSEEIREGEYHLSPKHGAEGWTAPNRAQDLRGWWHDGVLEVSPRVDPGAWRFTYRLASVGRARAGGEVGVADVTFERA